MSRRKLQAGSVAAGIVATDSHSLGDDRAEYSGDGVTGPKSAVEAIQQGHEAAISIERFMAGADLARGRQKPREEPAPTPDGEFEKKPRVEPRKISLERRLTSFDEIEIKIVISKNRAAYRRNANRALAHAHFI